MDVHARAPRRSTARPPAPASAAPRRRRSPSRAASAPARARCRSRISLKPHCVSLNGRPGERRTIALKARPMCFRCSGAPRCRSRERRASRWRGPRPRRRPRLELGHLGERGGQVHVAQQHQVAAARRGFPPATAAPLPSLWPPRSSGVITGVARAGGPEQLRRAVRRCRRPPPRSPASSRPGGADLLRGRRLEHLQGGLASRRSSLYAGTTMDTVGRVRPWLGSTGSRAGRRAGRRRAALEPLLERAGPAARRTRPRAAGRRRS